ncbi:MAG: hypothetical protein WAX38_00370 [Minisyncoccia bacterium]
MNLNKIKKLIRFGIIATGAIVLGFFLSVKENHTSSGNSILLDFDTQTVSADTPPPIDSGSGSADSGSGDSGDSGSGDSGSGDCGS